MGRLRAILAIIAGFVTLGAVANLASRWLGADRELTLLAVMMGASALMSLALALQRRALRRRLRQLSAHQRQALELISDEAKFAMPRAGVTTVRNTVLVGKVMVNGPVLPLMLGPLMIMQTWFNLTPPVPQFIALGGGFIAAWLWWSVTVYHWRRWAQKRGMSPAEVQWHGQSANLLWPQGTLLLTYRMAGMEMMRASPDMDTNAAFYLAAREAFPSLAAKVDRHFIKDWDQQPAENTAYSWFGCAANALNEEMRREASLAECAGFFTFVAHAFCSGGDEVKRCIDVSFVENLFWQVSPAKSAAYWPKLPAVLQALYLGFHHTSPL